MKTFIYINMKFFDESIWWYQYMINILSNFISLTHMSAQTKEHCQKNKSVVQIRKIKMKDVSVKNWLYILYSSMSSDCIS